MTMLQFGPLSQIKRTRKMIHLIHKTESNSLGCIYFTVVYFTQLSISQFAVIHKQLRLLSFYKIYSSIDSSIDMICRCPAYHQDRVLTVELLKQTIVQEAGLCTWNLHFIESSCVSRHY